MASGSDSSGSPPVAVLQERVAIGFSFLVAIQRSFE